MAETEATKGTMDPAFDPAAANRGKPASQGSGEVTGSGAGAGAGGAAENFDLKEDANDARVNNDGGR